VGSSKDRRRRQRRRRDHQSATGVPSRDPLPEAIAQLRTLQQAGFRVLDAGTDAPADFRRPGLRVEVDTSDIHTTGVGLAVGSSETLHVQLPAQFPDVPPQVYVPAEDRFLGYPHVILGRMLCVYLDPKREWHPTYGMAQLVERVWEWFDNAANDRFDPRASLFHAVGGANPATMPGPTVVLRSVTPADLALRSRAVLRSRTLTRSDLVSWGSADRQRSDEQIPVFRVPQPCPLGLTSNAGHLAAQIEASDGCPGTEVLRGIQRSARSGDAGDPTHLCLVVDHPTEADLPTVVVGRIDAATSDRLRAGDEILTPNDTKIGWLPMSDERPGVTTPRDAARPASGFAGKSIEIWGCGGLGSWIAELIVRAHPHSLTIRDTGLVAGGHLVRQNYIEDDVGAPKVEALARRLQAIADGVDVNVGGLSALDALADNALPQCDIVIDATISEAVAYRLDSAARDNAGGPLLCQVATDQGSATRGLIVVATGESMGGPASIEADLADLVLDNATFEPFHTFWTPPVAGSELTPAPGCSTPTYHGAAADLAALAGSIVSVLGQLISSPVAGIVLLGSAHANVHPPYTFIKHAPLADASPAEPDGVVEPPA